MPQNAIGIVRMRNVLMLLMFQMITENPLNGRVKSQEINSIIKFKQVDLLWDNFSCHSLRHLNHSY